MKRNITRNDIYYSPEEIRFKLNRSIESVVSNINCYCVDPISSFTRNRCFSAETLIKFILQLSSHSANSHLISYFESFPFTPSASALSQRRRLLYPEVFERINDVFLNQFDNLSTIKGYYILAEDGSDVNLPFLDDETAINHQSNAPYCQYHLNALYDCINHVFWDCKIDLPSKTREVDALISMLDCMKYPDKSIITADRGYESYNLIAHLLEKKQKFVIRVKDIHTKSGIMTNIDLPNDSFDCHVTRTLSRLQTNEVKSNKENTFLFLHHQNLIFLITLMIFMRCLSVLYGSRSQTVLMKRWLLI